MKFLTVGSSIRMEGLIAFFEEFIAISYRKQKKDKHYREARI